MRRDRRPLALVPLALVACVLPTPLGELPSTSAASETAGTMGIDGSTTIDIGVGSTEEPPSVSDTGIAEPPPPHAWAMRYDEWVATMEPSDDETGGNSGGTDGGTDTSTGPTPDTLVVQLSSGPDDCVDPHAGLECGGYWTLTVMIPPELQAPGTYDLAAELSALATMTGEPEEGGTCSAGAGTVEGTAELFEVSPQQVTGRLSTTDVFGIEPNLEFVAPRC